MVSPARKIKYYGLEFTWEDKRRFEAEVASELGFQEEIIFEYQGYLLSSLPRNLWLLLDIQFEIKCHPLRNSFP